VAIPATIHPEVNLNSCPRETLFFVLERSHWFILFKGERSLSSFRETPFGIQAGEILLFFMFSERTIIEITLEDMLMPQQIEDC
jgi:hypothetical protein